jgi:putative endopeptidase
MRINGQLANIDAWYSAFGIASGDRLYAPPENRVSIWLATP